MVEFVIYLCRFAIILIAYSFIIPFTFLAIMTNNKMHVGCQVKLQKQIAEDLKK